MYFKKWISVYFGQKILITETTRPKQDVVITRAEAATIQILCTSLQLYSFFSVTCGD